jgi:N-acetylglutamate synthase-like GNAT family acetyltransferase
LDSHAHLSPWLASVLVERDHRCRGIGAALSERATREARILGFTRLYLFTLDRQRFYERLGWSILEEATFREHPVTVMARDLAG